MPPFVPRSAASQGRIARQQLELLQHQLKEASAARATAEAALAKLRKEAAAQAHRKHQVGAGRGRVLAWHPGCIRDAEAGGSWAEQAGGGTARTTDSSCHGWLLRCACVPHVR